MNDPIKNLSTRAMAIFSDSIRAIEIAQRTLPNQVSQAANRLADTLSNNGKILICGNGGSASDSLHFSAELINKFDRIRRPLAAISLAADVSTLTSIANDESYDKVFSKQVEGLGQANDTLVVITTSGNSPSILQAVRAAHKKKIRCIALNGKDGGELSTLLQSGDIDIIAPGDSTARIQEIHAIIIHLFCDLIDHLLFDEPSTC